MICACSLPDGRRLLRLLWSVQAKGCIIGARYSCVRHQGFKERSGPGSAAFLAPENQIIDYAVQRYRVLKWTATVRPRTMQPPFHHDAMLFSRTVLTAVFRS